MAATTATSTEQGHFIKQLVSTDKVVREKASRTFVLWIQANQGITLADSRKLWKGLFYGMWSADKSKVQEDLAERLTDVILTLQSSSCVLYYLEAFWNIMAIEWYGIDRLRLDKFYLLMKRTIFYTFRWLELSGWSEDSVYQIMGILAKYPLNLDDKVCPDGIRLFLAEYFFKECQKAAKATDGLSEPVIDAMLTPFLQMIANYPKPSIAKSFDSEIFGTLSSMESLMPRDIVASLIFKVASKR